MGITEKIGKRAHLLWITCQSYQQKKDHLSTAVEKWSKARRKADISTKNNKWNRKVIHKLSTFCGKQWISLYTEPTAK